MNNEPAIVEQFRNSERRMYRVMKDVATHGWNPELMEEHAQVYDDIRRIKAEVIRQGYREHIERVTKEVARESRQG